METLKAVAARKSVRSYRQQQIPNAALNTILGAGCAAPVAEGAYGSIHILVLQDPHLLQEIAAAADSRPDGRAALYGAPTLVLISCSKEMSQTAGVASAACIAQNIMLAAVDLSLGSAFVHSVACFIARSRNLMKKLNLPDNFRPAEAVVLGYAALSLNGERKLEHSIQISRITGQEENK